MTWFIGSDWNFYAIHTLGQGQAGSSAHPAVYQEELQRYTAGTNRQFFGFTEACTLYGGRFFSSTELSRYDVRSLYTMNINLRLPLTCPSKICYPSISKANKTGDYSLFRCSQKLKDRNIIGMFDFDLD